MCMRHLTCPSPNAKFRIQHIFKTAGLQCQMDPITGTALAAVSVKSLESIVDRLQSAAGSAAKKQISNWRTRKGLKTAFQRMTAVRKVKTIWQIDKEVDLLDFYYPTRVLYDSAVISVRSLLHLPDTNCLFTGTAGQGKSILLRYLCASELAAGQRFPLFLQLRRLDENTRLMDLALTACTDLGLPLSEDGFVDLADQGLIVLLLDGFDEVPEDLRSRTISDIESLAHRHIDMRIYSTSRPGSGIEQSAVFRVLSLVPLDTSDLPNIIRRLTDDEALTKQLLVAIRRKPSLQELITTPLLVTLLLITYKAEQTIPDSMSDFYEGLFDLLLSRHDKTKPGFIRPRQCPLGNRAMEEVFDAFCFTTKREERAAMKHDDAFKAARSSLRYCGHSSDPEKFIEDIVKITCLLVEEGRLLHFVHKSVQEFHSARFIKSLQDEKLRQFYDRIRRQEWRAWGQELQFLREMDSLRFIRFFALPDIEELLNGAGSDQEINASVVRRVFGELGIAPLISSGQVRYYSVPREPWFCSEHFAIIVDCVSKMEFDPNQWPQPFRDGSPSSDGATVHFQLADLLHDERYRGAVLDLTRQMLERAEQVKEEYETLLARRDSVDFLGELFAP